MNDKIELRRRMREMRGTLAPETLEQAGRAAAERVLALPELSAPTTVCCYLSVRRELPTDTLVAALLARGHTVAVPRVLDDERMEARVLVEPRVTGAHGIPTSDGPVADDVPVVLCPGLAFDPDGGRLGYGAGYYDRWLAEHPTAIAIGLVVDDGVLPEIPVDAHDHRMHVVVSPTRTIRRPRSLRVVAGVWIRDGRVLAAQRGPHTSRAGMWELPGGKVEPGESDAAALARELSEELSITVQVGAIVGCGRHDEPGTTIELLAYEVRTDDEPVLEEHSAIRWLRADELDSVDWAPADIPLVASVRKRLLRHGSFNPI